MSFGSWLQEQEKRPDDVGKFAQLAYGDFNSGCAPKYFSGALEWRDHFQKYHPRRMDDISVLLGEAFKEYAHDLANERSKSMA